MDKLPKKKLQLPKSVLDMKFMKKTKDRIEKELQNTQDHESLYSNIITEEMRAASGNYISESSFIFCEELLEGRLSFKGMNPEIESLMQGDRKEESDDGEMQKDIPDEELANRMMTNNKRKMDTDVVKKYREYAGNIRNKQKKMEMKEKMRKFRDFRGNKKKRF